MVMVPDGGYDRPRTPRTRTDIGIYHVMLRGINKQTIFPNNIDKQFFIDTISKYKKELGFDIFAYCVMDNHVHLLIRDNNCQLETIFKKINTSYAIHYNKKYNRIGHLFQDRYKSEAVLNDKQLVLTLKYIHYNPIKAGICKDLEFYDFSSYKDYTHPLRTSITDQAYILKIMGGVEEYMRFHTEAPELECMDIDNTVKKGKTDADVKLMINRILSDGTPEHFEHIPKPERDKYIRILKSNHIPCAQISRITGLSIDTVKKVSVKTASLENGFWHRENRP